MEGQKLMLIDTRAKYFTTRHLIVGVSRATDQKDVHVASEKEEKSWMDDARLQFSIPMQGGTDQSLFTEDDYDETNDLALYYNDQTTTILPMIWRYIAMNSTTSISKVRLLHSCSPTRRMMVVAIWRSILMTQMIALRL